MKSTQPSVARPSLAGFAKWLSRTYRLPLSPRCCSNAATSLEDGGIVASDRKSFPVSEESQPRREALAAKEDDHLQVAPGGRGSSYSDDHSVPTEQTVLRVNTVPGEQNGHHASRGESDRPFLCSSVEIPSVLGGQVEQDAAGGRRIERDVGSRGRRSSRVENHFYSHRPPTCDEEQKLLATERFGNKRSGCPNRNMTFHGFKRLKFNNVRTQHGTDRRTVIKVEDGRVTVESNERGVNEESRKRKAEYEAEGDPRSKRIRIDNKRFEEVSYMMLEDEVTRKMEDALKCGRRHNRMECHIRECMREWRRFDGFYREGDKLLVSRAQFERACCVETLFSQIFHVYGHNYGRKGLFRCLECNNTLHRF